MYLYCAGYQFYGTVCPDTVNYPTSPCFFHSYEKNVCFFHSYEKTRSRVDITSPKTKNETFSFLGNPLTEHTPPQYITIKLHIMANIVHRTAKTVRSDSKHSLPANAGVEVGARGHFLLGLVYVPPIHH